ncbi:MAG: DciA family protein [Caulobacteraceae bacterium]
MPRSLPTPQEAAAILASKRTRPIHRPPPRAGRALSKVVKALDERFGQGADGLKARWREIAGDVLAARTEPVKLVKGRGGAGAVLEIRVDGPAAALIQHQAPEILARVRLFLGADAVERLRIVQGPVRHKAPQGPAGVKAAGARRRAVGPLDAAAEARLEADLAAAPDGPLKTALRRLGREVMRAAERR